MDSMKEKVFLDLTCDLSFLLTKRLSCSERDDDVEEGRKIGQDLRLRQRYNNCLCRCSCSD